MESKREICPALLNQKDILEDALFDSIFDREDWVEVGKNYVLGGIDEKPYMIEWAFNTNQITFHPCLETSDEDVYDVVSGIADEINSDENGNIRAVILHDMSYYVLRFYFKEV